MARSKDAGCGTRYVKGILSGATIGLYESAVTLATSGIEYSAGSFVTPTELGYMASAAGNVVAGTAAGYKLSGGTVQYAGASVLVSTGLSSVVAFVGSQGKVSSGASVGVIEWVLSTGTTGGVTVGLLSLSQGNDVTKNYSVITGVSIGWLAFGT